MLSKDIQVSVIDQEGRSSHDVNGLVGFAKKKMGQYVDLLNSLGQTEGRKTLRMTDGTIIDLKPTEYFGKIQIRIPTKKVGKEEKVGKEFPGVVGEVFPVKVKYPLKAMQRGVLPCYTLIDPNSGLESTTTVIGYLPVIRTGEEIGYEFERQRWSDVRNEGYGMLPDSDFDSDLQPDIKIEVKDFDEVEDVCDHGPGLYCNQRLPTGDILNYHIPFDWVDKHNRGWELEICGPSGNIKTATWGPRAPVTDGVIHGGFAGSTITFYLSYLLPRVSNDNMFPAAIYDDIWIYAGDDGSLIYTTLTGFSDCSEGPWLGFPASGLWQKYFLPFCYREATENYDSAFSFVYYTGSASKWWKDEENTYDIFINCSGREILIKDNISPGLTWLIINNTLRIYEALGETYYLYSFVLQPSVGIYKYYYGVILKNKDNEYTHYQAIYDAKTLTLLDDLGDPYDVYVHDIEPSNKDATGETFVSNGDFFLINAEKKIL